MSPTLTQIRCPKCSMPAQAAIEQLVDVGQDPASKARFLSGSLNHFRCPACGFEGQLATPLVYHDPAKELLLSFIPMELGMRQEDQERFVGQMINLATSRLAPEQRKGYLLRPQTVLTMQGLVERVLEADGITRQEIEAQRAKMRLLEELLRTPPEGLEAFAQSHDSELDEGFFQLASLTLASSREPRAAEAAAEHLSRVLDVTSYGKRLEAKEAELKAAIHSLRDAGDALTQEKLLDLFIRAPNDDRVVALVNLARPALDYRWFQMLSERIDKSQGPERQTLEALRQRVLEVTEELDRVQEARAARAASVLKMLLEAPDLDKALPAALPYVDEMFLGILQANLRAAKERGDQPSISRLELVDQKLTETIRKSLPAGLRLAQDLLQIEDEAQAEALLTSATEGVDSDLVNTLMATAQKLEQRADHTAAERIRRLYRKALRLTMKAGLQRGQKGTSPTIPGQ